MGSKRILVIDGHPRVPSLSHGLAEAYARGAREAGHEVRLVHLRELTFDPIMRNRYRDNLLEPDLIQQQENMRWCEHLVVVTPVNWMATPSLLKGFFDRIITPGFAFKYHKGSLLPIPERLLTGRSSRVIYTQGGPFYLTSTVGFDAFFKGLKYGTIAFCGFWPVRRTCFTRADQRGESNAQKWFDKVYKLGLKGK